MSAATNTIDLTASPQAGGSTDAAALRRELVERDAKIRRLEEALAACQPQQEALSIVPTQQAPASAAASCGAATAPLPVAAVAAGPAAAPLLRPEELPAWLKSIRGESQMYYRKSPESAEWFQGIVYFVTRGPKFHPQSFRIYGVGDTRLDALALPLLARAATSYEEVKLAKESGAVNFFAALGVGDAVDGRANDHAPWAVSPAASLSGNRFR